MMNTKPTYGLKNIDVLISDMSHLFCESVIIPNVPTDLPSSQAGGGVPSDHPVVYCQPKVNRQEAPKKEVLIKRTRRYTKERMNAFGLWIQSESWETLYDAAGGMADQFVKICFPRLMKYFPRRKLK